MKNEYFSTLKKKIIKYYNLFYKQIPRKFICADSSCTLTGKEL